MERRAFLGAGAAALVAGCARVAGPGIPAPAPTPRLPSLLFDPARLIRHTVCLRPFRAAGPRLETERFGAKTVIHNYGHGGSGWSLGWGCAEDAAALARNAGANEFAVVGAGAIGLTTALRLIETGARVTIYAAEFPAETRSARATGVWSPSSRIGLDDGVDAGFGDRWERWARATYAAHIQHVGLDGAPVELLTQYNMAGGSEPTTAPTRPFLRLGRRVSDLTPPWSDLPEADSPFPGHFARAGTIMVFNIAEYADRLVRQFLSRGGRMVRRALPDRAAVLALPEPVIINCMGYGAKAIWGDDALVPVRGQIGWLLPQPEARHALWYDNVNAVSRRDGVIVQYLGSSDDWGFGDANETVDKAETLMALARMRSLSQPLAT